MGMPIEPVDPALQLVCGLREDQTCAWFLPGRKREVKILDQDDGGEVGVVLGKDRSKEGPVSRGDRRNQLAARVHREFAGSSPSLAATTANDASEGHGRAAANGAGDRRKEIGGRR